MDLCLKLFICFFLLRDIQSAGQISWLPCRFTDEKVSVSSKSYIINGKSVTGFFDTKHHYRAAALQFGLKGDPPKDPETVTFLITPSKLDLRQLLAGAEVERLSCELHRYSTDGSNIRWPVKGEQPYNRWFSVNISHNHPHHRFQITSFIRQATDQPLTGQHDYKSWPVIQDKETLTTSVVMMIQTQTPVVISSLNVQPKLHCQFYIDHKSPRVTVEWTKLHTNVPLFSHESPSGQTQGSGVELKQLAEGGATYTTPLTEVGSEGKYFCSVHVHPLLGRVPVQLEIEEPPDVSLNVGPTLTLYEESEKKVVCRAEGYYPLDVDIYWSHKGSTEVGPRVDTSQLSGHSNNPDRTYSLSAFFYLKPKLWDSGRKFTCIVSHRSLPAPITKTFTVHVTEPGQWIFYFNVLTLMVVMVLILRYMFRGRRYRTFF